MIQFYKPTLKRKDMDSVLQTMVNEQIGPGERGRAFVQYFCETIAATSAIAYRTYPDCLSDALKLMGAQKGVKVAVSPLSPLIYKSVIESTGAQMVYVDVNKETCCPDELLVAQSGAEILLLHETLGTLPVKYNEQTTFAEKYDYSSVKVIEDISDSIGSRVKDEAYAGSFGQIVVCALEEDSIVSAGGGAIMAVRGEYVNALRGKRPSKYLRMPDMNAALGLVQLANLDENSNKRREILKVYQQSLSKTRHKQFGLGLIDFASNGGAFGVFLDSKPEETIKFAQKHDVPVKLAFADCLIKDFEGDPFEAFPVAASFFYRTVEFPIYPFLKMSEIDSISKVVAHLP
ncbi:MAG: DegT/DnrJ/EryC1/StrS aminotransferase family protein [Sphaerochaetaceae bacterium]|nr:DegT/DnrJ/EryC1/StrS aminotransferase family protein [Sphaerochaetaceae bacterium]